MSPSPATLREELASLFRLAAPVAIVQFGLTLMGAVDTMMVGHYSSTALAAVALGNVYAWGVLVLGFGTLMCLDPIVAQAHGAGDRPAIVLAFQRGLVLAAFLSVFLVIAYQKASPVLRALGQREELIPVASAFVRASALSAPAVLLFVVLRQTIQAMGVVRPTLIAIIVGNLCNVGLNWVFVYGHLGVPPLGAVGSGYATSLSRWVTTGMMALVAVPVIGEGALRPVRGLFDLRALRHMLAIGIPIGLQVSLESGVFLTVALLVGSMNQDIFAAHQIAISLATLSFMVPLGIGGAAATRVGNAVGRGDQSSARGAALLALGAGAAVMTVSAAAFALAPRLLASAYTNDENVIALAAGLLPIAALFQIFDGTQAVGCGVLRGIADTRAAAIINVLGFWVLGLPLGLWLCYRGGLGARGLWCGLTAGLFFVAVALVLRVRSRFAIGAAPVARV